MTRAALLLALALCAGCTDPSLELEDCRSALATVRSQKKVDAQLAGDVTCPEASAFQAAWSEAGATDFASSLRRDRLAFASLLADRCGGAGSEGSVKACILATSARVQVGCASAVSEQCAGVAGKEDR